MTCKMCKERGKTWEGSDPKCYFDNDHNWNCATLNAIRDICGDWDTDPRDGVHLTYCEDEKYATIKVDEVDLGTDDYIPCLYVQWYKRRGETDALWLLGEGIARKPTEAELLAIIKHYEEYQIEKVEK